MGNNVTKHDSKPVETAVVTIWNSEEILPTAQSVIVISNTKRIKIPIPKNKRQAEINATKKRSGYRSFFRRQHPFAPEQQIVVTSSSYRSNQPKTMTENSSKTQGSSPDTVSGTFEGTQVLAETSKAIGLHSTLSTVDIFAPPETLCKTNESHVLGTGKGGDIDVNHVLRKQEVQIWEKIKSRGTTLWAIKRKESNRSRNGACAKTARNQTTNAVEVKFNQQLLPGTGKPIRILSRGYRGRRETAGTAQAQQIQRIQSDVGDISTQRKSSRSLNQSDGFAQTAGNPEQKINILFSKSSNQALARSDSTLASILPEANASTPTDGLSNQASAISFDSE